MYKVFYNNRPVYLVRDPEQLTGARGFRAIPYTDNKNLEKELDYFERNHKERGLVFYHPDEAYLFESFCDSFRLIDAAGGLVVNDLGQILMIKRRGMWDLPKGKLQKEEHPEQGALREVSEETGIRDLTIGRKIMDTYHTFFVNHVASLKKTTWYFMQASANAELIPQTEEEITEVTWIRPPVPAKILQMNFASITDVLGETGMIQSPEESNS